MSKALEVYKQYKQKYGEDPATERQLLTFAKSIKNPISFKEAKQLMFDCMCYLICT